MFKTIITKLGKDSGVIHNKKVNDFITLDYVVSYKIKNISQVTKYSMLMTVITYKKK